MYLDFVLSGHQRKSTFDFESSGKFVPSLARVEGGLLFMRRQLCCV